MRFIIIALILFVSSFLFSCKEKTLIPVKDSSLNLTNRKYDIEFEKELIQQGIDEDGKINDILKISKPDTITSLGFFNAISRYDGIEIFHNLRQLSIENKSGNFKNLDLNKNENLIWLFITANTDSICSIKTVNCKNLQTLIINIKGKVDDFSLEHHLKLESISITNDQYMTLLDLSRFNNLKTILLANTVLKKLILPKTTNLNNIYLNNNYWIDELNFSIYQNLAVIYIINMPSLKQLILPDKSTSLISVYLEKIQYLFEIDLKKYSQLNYVDLREIENIAQIDISSSKNIEHCFSINNPKLRTICVNPKQKIDSVVTSETNFIPTKWFKTGSELWTVCK